MPEQTAAILREFGLELAVTKILAENPPLPRALECLLAAICEAGSWSAGGWWVPRNGDSGLACESLWPRVETPSDDSRPVGSAAIASAPPAFPTMVYEAGSPFWISGGSVWPRKVGRRRVSLPKGVHAAMGFPLISSGRPVGAMAFYSERACEPEPEFRSFFDTLGRLLGQFLASKQFEATKDLLVMALDQVPDTIVVTDLDGRLEYVNRAFEERVGCNRSEALGQVIGKWGRTRQDPARVKEIWDTLRRGESWQGDLERRDPGGRAIINSRILPVKDEEGNVVRSLAVTRDVTRERQLESQLMQSQKMEAIGQLAGGLAHDFTNLLTVILGHTQILRTAVPEEHPFALNLQAIRRAGERGTALVRQLLVFSRRNVEEAGDFDLRDLLAQAREMLERLLGEKVRRTWDLGSDPLYVCADRSQIEMAVMNLALNARDAMPDGGDLHIVTRRAGTAAPPGSPLLPPGVPDGRYVLLTVTDTGSGMTPEIQERIFEPFFTTKAPDKGTGLGLSTVFGVVKQAGGHIRVESEVGRGTEFRLFFPEIVSPRLAAPTEADADPDPDYDFHGRGTILVAEDEENVRDLLASALIKTGYTVLQAEDGGRALEIAAAHAGDIDLLVTDIVMPYVDGPELSRRLVALRPDLKVLFVSGYPLASLETAAFASEIRELLQKPVTERALISKVRALLGR